MSLLEISNRDIEKIEKEKFNIVGRSEGDHEADIALFKDFLFKALVKIHG